MPPTEHLAALKNLPAELKLVVIAFSTLSERIRSLPKADRADLFELVLMLKERPPDAELKEIMDSMEEILTSAPVEVQPLSLTDRPSDELMKWKAYAGKRILKFRKEAGLTQDQLAEKADLPQPHLSRLETGKHSPTRFTLEKIAKALGVPVSKLDPSAD